MEFDEVYGMPHKFNRPVREPSSPFLPWQQTTAQSILTDFLTFEGSFSSFDWSLFAFAFPSPLKYNLFLLPPVKYK